MAKRKPDTGAIYISPRLRASLEPVGRCALTVVTAPMGYGKTTAVNWFLGTQPPGCAIRISIYSDSLPALWQSGRRAFRDAGLTALEGFECPGDPASAGLLADTLCRELRRQEPWYVFLDDLHLMPDRRVAHFLCELAARLPDNVHLIAASRDKVLSGDQVLRLGGRLHRIGAGQLRLEGDELAAYAHRFGAALDREQLAELQQATEGWMAAVYLHLQALADRGTAPAETADIYDMFTAAMLRPLPPPRQKVLAVMGLADEFTGEMAQFITKEPDTAEILSDLTAKNAFVTRLPGGGYRFHHMMKACAQRDFDALPPQEQAAYQARYGHWYAENGQYLQALAAYSKAGRWDDALEVVQRDAGILLAALRPQQVLELLDRCGDQVLMEHPTALLVLMRRMFTWGRIPRMRQLKELLLESVRRHPELTDRQRGNLLGECDLIESFLYYNDIGAMSRFHRSASRQIRLLRHWDITVAMETPFTPQRKTATNRMSSPMLHRAAVVMAISGVRLSPSERRKPDRRLNDITNTTPPKMTRRYWQVRPMVFSGERSAVSMGQSSSSDSRVRTTVMAAERRMLCPAARRSSA